MTEYLEHFEALTGVNVEDFFRSLFDGDPSLLDHSVAVNGDGSAQGGEEIILAAHGFSPALSPDQWPGNAAENPREYLEYLLDKAERDQRALEDWYAEVVRRHPVVWTENGPVAVETGAEKAVQDLIDLKRDIEAARKGVFPPSQEKLTELYNRLMSIRGDEQA